METRTDARSEPEFHVQVNRELIAFCEKLLARLDDADVRQRITVRLEEYRGQLRYWEQKHTPA